MFFTQLICSLPIVVFGETLSLLILSAREVVCQNCWLPVERNQLSEGGFILETSYVCLWPVKVYTQKVTFGLMLVGTTISLFLYAKTVGSQSQVCWSLL
jgi:hypothetical protein